MHLMDAAFDGDQTKLRSRRYRRDMELERRPVWECEGCGRIDDPRPCVGVCRDRKVEYVLAAEYEREVAALRRVLEVIAHTTPRDGEALRHWKALQQRARRVLADES
jgi:hypothetical protein